MGTTTTVEDLVARAGTLVRTPGRSILGIAGAPGSGKSTLAAQLVAALGPEVAVLVPMDGFHLSNGVLTELGLRNVKGAPQTFDSYGYAALLNRIRSQREGETIYAPHFDRALEESIAGSIRVDAHIPLVITEGNYLLLDTDAWPEARRCLSRSWFLSPDAGLRRDRLVERHIRHGKSASEATRWALGTDEDNAILIGSTAKSADDIFEIASTPLDGTFEF